MVVVGTKRHGIWYYDVWYADAPFVKNGIIVYKSAERPIGNNISIKIKKTLITDLLESEEEIIGHFTKNCRYEVRRASRENISTQIKCGEDVTAGDVQRFVEYYLAFRESKGFSKISADEVIKELEDYRKSGVLAITSASVEGTKVVYHTYIVDENRVRLFQSASLFRVDETVPAKIVGIANRFLHKEDMIEFKKRGKKEYDWGGAGENGEVASITRFKESFGGTPKVFFDGKVYQGIVARLYGFCTAIKRK